MRASIGLIDTMLSAAKNALDGGLCYIYAGTMPATADDPLDMDATHTEIAVLSLGGAGAGVSFEPVADGVLSKDATQEWEGTIAFDGAESGETTLTPTFFRFCASGDDGRSGGSNLIRLQGSAGGPTSSAVARLTSTTATANGSNTLGAVIFNFRLLPGS